MRPSSHSSPHRHGGHYAHADCMLAQPKNLGYAGVRRTSCGSARYEILRHTSYGAGRRRQKMDGISAITPETFESPGHYLVYVITKAMSPDLSNHLLMLGVSSLSVSKVLSLVTELRSLLDSSPYWRELLDISAYASMMTPREPPVPSTSSRPSEPSPSP